MLWNDWNSVSENQLIDVVYKNNSIEILIKRLFRDVLTTIQQNTLIKTDSQLYEIVKNKYFGQVDVYGYFFVISQFFSTLKDELSEIKTISNEKSPIQMLIRKYFLSSDFNIEQLRTDISILKNMYRSHLAFIDQLIDFMSENQWIRSHHFYISQSAFDEMHEGVVDLIKRLYHSEMQGVNEHIDPVTNKLYFERVSNVGYYMGTDLTGYTTRVTGYGKHYKLGKNRVSKKHFHKKNVRNL